jgi:peptidyl-prolyl cis-trans isomerase D
MLQALRSKVGSWVVKILFFLLILSFGVWGIGDIFRDQVSDTVAEVGDARITTAELDRAFRGEVERMRQLVGGQFDFEQARQFGILDAALDRLVERSLYTQEAGAMGLAVPDALVLDQIRAEPAFANSTGQFDPDLFRRVLAANNLSEAAYVDALRTDVARATLVGAVGQGADAPSPVVDDIFRRQAERRVAETLHLPRSAMPDPGVPDEEALAAFHRDRAVRFTAPEYRTLTVARLAPQDLADEVAVPEEDLQAAYEFRRDEFRQPERRDVEQVLVQDEATARRVADAALGGTPLAEAATAEGTEALPLPDIRRDDLFPELADTIFSIGEGEIGGPVQSPLGWHVFRVSALTPASERSFDEVRGELLEALKLERAADRVYEVANQLEDELAGGASVDEAAQRLGLELTRLPQVDATGNTPQGRPVENLDALRPVLEQAFTLGAGEQSRLIETPDGAYYVVQVNEVTPAALRPLDQVRDQVIAAWQAERRSEAAAARAQELADEIGAGADMAGLAAANGAEFRTTEPFTRSGDGADGLPAALVEQMFAAKPGGVAAAPSEEGQVIARLSRIDVPDPAESEAQIARLRQQLDQSVASDLLAQFGNALRGRYGVEVNRGTLDQMYQQN